MQKKSYLWKVPQNNKCVAWPGNIIFKYICLKESLYILGS